MFNHLHLVRYNFLQMNLRYRLMQPDDWPGVARVYEEGIRTGHATFQNKVPSWEEWDAAHVQGCRLVAASDEGLVGWAALTPVSGRCVYAGVAEVSVYVAEGFRGRHIGRQLLERLIIESEVSGFWTLQAGIFPENAASVHVHEQCGFRVVGRREKIGKMHGGWRDTLLLERRSTLTGID